MKHLELDAFARVVSVSNAEKQTKKILNDEISKRQVILDSEISAMAISSDVKMDGRGVEI